MRNGKAVLVRFGVVRLGSVGLAVMDWLDMAGYGSAR